MKRCKNLACVKWDTLDSIKHALNSDLTVINGLELSIRQSWFKDSGKGDLNAVIGVLNTLRWRLMDRVGQINDIIIENDKE